MIENYRLTAALAYARMGWRVFPTHAPKLLPDGTIVCSCGDRTCGNVGKHPATPNGLKDASSDVNVIQKWWANMPWANVSVATGAVSGIVVVDVDAGKGGNESWQELIAAYGEVPMTPICETGGGGNHLFFAYPGAVDRPVNPWRNSAELLGKGIDTRGDGGYVVAAPSYHRSDTHYAWRIAPDQTPLVPLPAWIIAMLEGRDIKPRPVVTVQRPPMDDAQQVWLGKALAKVTMGNRNDTGFWLAAQLRDAGVSLDGARATLGYFADRCPQDGATYTEREAMASVEQAYARAPRERAVSINAIGHSHIWTPPKPFSLDDDAPFGGPITAMTPSAMAELRAWYDGIQTGVIYDATWPWPMLSGYTQSLIPGTTTLICGDPGVGKTYLFLQSLLYWQQRGIDAAVFFIEKRQRFYGKRLLALLENNYDFLNMTWVNQHTDQVNAALERHGPLIAATLDRIVSSDGQQVTLGSLLSWIRTMAEAGKRVICIDPISAAVAGSERWAQDDDFVIQAEAIAEKHGASLVYITHSKKGNRNSIATGHDMAHGAAYFRFSDTLLWLHLQKRNKPRDVRFRDVHGMGGVQRPDVFMQIQKAREGPGAGQELAFKIASGGRMTEQGVVIEDVETEP